METEPTERYFLTRVYEYEGHVDLQYEFAVDDAPVSISCGNFTPPDGMRSEEYDYLVVTTLKKKTWMFRTDDVWFGSVVPVFHYILADKVACSYNIIFIASNHGLHIVEIQWEDQIVFNYIRCVDLDSQICDIKITTAYPASCFVLTAKNVLYMVKTPELQCQKVASDVLMMDVLKESVVYLTKDLRTVIQHPPPATHPECGELALQSIPVSIHLFGSRCTIIKYEKEYGLLGLQSGHDIDFSILSKRTYPVWASKDRTRLIKKESNGHEESIVFDSGDVQIVDFEELCSDAPERRYVLIRRRVEAGSMVCRPVGDFLEEVDITVGADNVIPRHPIDRERLFWELNDIHSRREVQWGDRQAEQYVQLLAGVADAVDGIHMAQLLTVQLFELILGASERWHAISRFAIAKLASIVMTRSPYVLEPAERAKLSLEKAAVPTYAFPPTRAQLLAVQNCVIDTLDQDTGFWNLTQEHVRAVFKSIISFWKFCPSGVVRLACACYRYRDAAGISVEQLSEFADHIMMRSMLGQAELPIVMELMLYVYAHLGEADDQGSPMREKISDFWHKYRVMDSMQEPVNHFIAWYMQEKIQEFINTMRFLPDEEMRRKLRGFLKRYLPISSDECDSVIEKLGDRIGSLSETSKELVMAVQAINVNREIQRRMLESRFDRAVPRDLEF